MTERSASTIRDIGKAAVARWWRDLCDDKARAGATTNISVASDVVLDTIAAPEHRDALMAWLIEAGVKPAQAPDRYKMPSGGEAVVEYGHRCACAHLPGHEGHDQFEDYADVIPWNERFHARSAPAEITRNGHRAILVRRAVFYSPWEPV